MEDLEYLSTDTPMGSGSIALSTKGWMRYEELQKSAGEGTQAFVAMWFAPEMTKIFDGPISDGIRAAGWRPFRVDRKEHNDKIDDQIIAEIRRSRFVVADFTTTEAKGQRGGVYFEAGFAFGLGLQVIYTCQKEALPFVHFDNRQYNFIDWSTSEELAERLRHRIEATIGIGPVRLKP